MPSMILCIINVHCYVCMYCYLYTFIRMCVCMYVAEHEMHVGTCMSELRRYHGNLSAFIIRTLYGNYIRRCTHDRANDRLNTIWCS